MKDMVKASEKKGTKEQIRDVAIDLFSQKGYDAVSIREIARTVGINEASIYNHYKGKDDIMDSIIESLVADFNPGTDEAPMEALLEKYGPEQYMNVVGRAVMERMKEPRIGKVCRLICIDLYRNEKIRGFFKATFMEPSYQMWEQIFQKMMDLGYIKDRDARLLSTEFFDYCVFLYFDCFIIRYQEAPYETLIDDMINKLSRHVKFIFDAVRITEASL